MKPKGGWRWFRLVAAILIMLDAIKRIIGDFRPADWAILIVDLLVLLVIVAEFGHHLLRARKVHQRLNALFKAMSKGQAVQESSLRSDDPAVSGWVESVKAWIRETQELLRSYSPQAETAFLHNAHAPKVRYGGIADEWTFALLGERLNNLRGIMEKPDVYF